MLDLPFGITNITAISAENFFGLALTPQPVITVHPQSQTVLAGTNVTLSARVVASSRWTHQWQREGVDLKRQEDLVFQHTDGTLAVWLMKGIVMQSAAFFDPKSPGDRNWRVAATGDLNKDGKADLVFQHTDGTLAVWFMNGINLASASLTSPSRAGNGWSVVGTGDFNRDGNDDLVFQHTDGTIAVWFMNSAAMTQATSPTHPVQTQMPNGGTS